MMIRNTVAAFVLTASTLSGVGMLATAESASAASCTKTSSGTCIRGGQFCPQAKFNKAGYDAKGRKYVCKGSRSHPHWMK